MWQMRAIMKTVSDKHVCYAMSSENTPALRVALGETFRLETKDCYSNQLTSEEILFSYDMWDTVNPATGPVFIEGARPGDILKVEIERDRR